jgi:hypothetical protein
MSGFVEWDDHEVLMASQHLQQSVGNLSPALREIGETLKESAQQRFSRKTSPGGQAWLGSSDLTIEFITTKSRVAFKAFQWTIHFNNQNAQYAWARKWGAMRPLPD